MSLNYLPDISLASIKDLVYDNKTDTLYQELDKQKYERIGLDRVYLILSDMMTNYGRVFGHSVLDVGCNNGLFSNFFSYYGNYVTGIDNFAIDRQKKYDALNFSASLLADFEEIDVCDFIATTDKSYDFVLLLSVAHQWEFGYAHTGDLKKDDERIRYIISSLFERTTKAIYYECPMDEPGFPSGYGIDFLSKYLNQYENASIVKISDTIASNGYIRSLYRITHIGNSNEGHTAEKEAYNRFASLQEEHCINGEIVTNGSFGRTKYAIYDGDSLIVSIRGNERDLDHPWGKQKYLDSVLGLWKEIKDNQPNHIVKVEKIYDEGYAKIEVVPGIPCMLTPQLPKWQQRKYYSSERNNNQLSLSTLAQMCQGLGELHVLGIAHGDPYPYNAVFYEGKVKWVDLGNISCDSQEIRKDICTFFLYTFPYVLSCYGKISECMIEQLDKELHINQDIHLAMKKASEILSEEYSDEKEIDKHDIAKLFGCVNHIIEKHLDSNQRYLLCYQAYRYHLDMITWMNTCNMGTETNHFLGLASQFAQLENAKSRLSIDAYMSRISEYEKQIATFQGRLGEQEEHLKKTMAMVKMLNDEIVIQKQQNAYREAELQRTIEAQKQRLKLLADANDQYKKLLEV